MPVCWNRRVLCPARSARDRCSTMLLWVGDMRRLLRSTSPVLLRASRQEQTSAFIALGDQFRSRSRRPHPGRATTAFILLVAMTGRPPAARMADRVWTRRPVKFIRFRRPWGNRVGLAATKTSSPRRTCCAAWAVASSKIESVESSPARA